MAIQCGVCPPANQAVTTLNKDCYCITLDPHAVEASLAREVVGQGIADLIGQRCPHLFSASPVFLSASQTERMAEIIKAIESVIALPAYRSRALAHAPAIALHRPLGASGVFFGYDFHVHEHGIGLIEINTNAGGAMLNSVLAKAQRACCEPMSAAMSITDSAEAFERDMLGMFQHEWRSAGRSAALATIAIVDAAPTEQYLYPEFLLFQQLFQRAGIRALICDPAALAWRDGALWCGDTVIDLVYNRLTDFALESPDCAQLRAAYLADAVVLTPHPQAHALYADKRNLALLSDALALQELGVPAHIQDILLAHIPRTEIVDSKDSERLWANRKTLFFKPAAGYGGRAAYRGDKITRRVWEDVIAGGYIAQTVVPPGQRSSGSVEAPETMKFDIRCYTYQGRVQWNAARLYQGQTTNFRTIGGGFAPVYTVPDHA